MSGEKFWIDERTGKVYRVYEPYVDPETARLNRKSAEKRKQARKNQKKARRRNRHG